ncbi:NADH dehydrogenase 1 alpha subcomplex subunit 6 [Coprinopsis cinerea okayama7|uniref:NADH dehydrogenase 1 alpha subcomplex subunit 6 n=1 Tax=Coprinopsis cinerea (strain Okayama-7 / 130 / ATCC MYA-4618 / FGSC 9003) TaxID=240176 RepID=A8NIK8_COPC7|nr:NADH dehydrogenase 1 alpha subcomplex subunit 6 [Coprinopsis cinerea okayama7\|eukprot:XP_001834019.1 NADH dehydrogenase 1 alpha subcomplex subunit 6 [Coprinopsis cinerea okayama7\
MTRAFTIPARLARSTGVSSSPAEARRKVLELYRDWYRSAPEICALYALSVSPAYVRHAIRQKFEKNRYLTDPRAIDVLILKSRQDYQETMNCWNQTDHVMGLLLNTEERPQRTFLQKFYEGRDEDASRPAATGVL